MIDKKVYMMDAGMVLFETEKPYGTVLGGIKTEMAKLGKPYRRNELDEKEWAGFTEDCDLFLDWSGLLRKRYITCQLEETGTVGKTEDGEDIHRYAVRFVEGNRNTKVRKIICCAVVCVLIAAGIIGIPSVPRFLTIIAAVAAAGIFTYQMLKPSAKAKIAVERLLSIMKEAK